MLNFFKFCFFQKNFFSAFVLILTTIYKIIKEISCSICYMYLPFATYFYKTDTKS